MTSRDGLAVDARRAHPAVMPGTRLLVAWALLIATVAGGAGGARAGDIGALSRAQAYRQAAALTALGRRLFLDPALSASGAQACASCHDPAHAFGPPDGAAVRLGGRDMRQPGLRAVPSLMYLQATPQFAEHFFDEDSGDDSVDNGPTGGLTWDGRADRGRDQARLPLLSRFEMANRSAAEVVARVRAAGYDAALRALGGAAAVRSPAAAFDWVLRALETFEQDAASFYPYSSRYDAYLAGTAALTAQEARGLALFNDPRKGNCAHCHISRRGSNGTPPQFTDFGLIALGAPRNPAIPANADPAYYDLGLCGPLRTDFATRPKYCGLFKTPSLRNVARRRVFFHNGVFRSLRQVIEFYVERDTDPAKWYPREADGRLRKYDDLPARYHANVNTEPPFGGAPGGRPALDAAEIDALIAFLDTLTDGYVPGG